MAPEQATQCPRLQVYQRQQNEDYKEALREQSSNSLQTEACKIPEGDRITSPPSSSEEELWTLG